MTAAVGFALDPIASHSGQFPLSPPSDAPLSTDVPSPVGVRPWGLRTVRAAQPGGSERPAWRYCHGQQVAVDAEGRPLAERMAKKPPSADTTSTVDGEDPPSSEDWKNDFAPDDPGLPV
jgi:putative ATP-grasp target RiPP